MTTQETGPQAEADFDWYAAEKSLGALSLAAVQSEQSRMKQLEEGHEQGWGY
jgi:hypothetical protein